MVAYRIALPADSRIHPVFHVSQLKKQLGRSDRVAEELPQVQDDSKLLLEPAIILDFRWSKAGKKVLQEALVHWTGTASEDAMWEPFPELQQQFLHLNLEDKIRLPVGGNVMTHGHKELEDGHVELEAAAESDSG